MFIMSGSGESFWKTVWLVVIFIIFVVPNMEYVRAAWEYLNSTVADVLESQDLADKKPTDIIYQFARKQQRDAFLSQYEAVATEYRDLATSVKRLARIDLIAEELKEQRIADYFRAAAAYIQRYRVDQSAESITNAKAYLERAAEIITRQVKPWAIGWLVFTALVAFCIGLWVKKRESEDMEGIAQDMLQRSRIGLVRSYLLPISVLTAWYFWQFDPKFTLFGFYFLIPLTFLWAFIPYVMAKSSV